MVRGTRAAVAVASIAAALPAPAADAAFPGANGRVAFVRTVAGNSDVWSMKADGSDQLDLSNDPGAEGGPSWSPDGTRIVFSRDTNGSDPSGEDIIVMNADGSGQTNLTNNAVQELSPSFSSDGQRIAYMRMGDIWVMNADGTGQAQLTATSELDTSPSFTPDGRILFSRIVTTPAFNQEIFVMGSDGSGQTNLTNDPAGDSSPDMAPDGTTITFTRLVSSSPLDFDIFVMNSDGSGQAGVVTGPALDTASVFAPDGNRIAFSRNPTGPAIAGEIFAAAGNGADPVNLTNTGDADTDSQPDWQPDLTPPPDTTPPDTVPPDTTLKRRPRNIVHGTRARYRFSSNETGSTFECKLDHRKFKPCNSPKKYKHLRDGKHTFRVRAIDAAGNVDPKPAKDSFKVR